jgi:hypothetical protein
VFIYDKRGDEIIMILAATEFSDETPTHYKPPSDKKFNDFRSTILQRIKKIYGATVESVNYTRFRLPMTSMIEYYDFYQKELCKK